MTLKEFYTNIGVDYDQVMDRLQSDEFAKHYLTLFLEDDQAQKLKEAVAAHRYEEAFEAAHSVKGICLNLELKPISDAVAPVVERVRNAPEGSGEISGLEAAYRSFEAEYQRVCQLMRTVE